MKKAFLSIVVFAALSPLVRAQSNVSTQVVSDVFQDFSNSASAGTASRTFTGVEFHAKEATVGSPYLYTDWVKGSVVTNNDSVVTNPNYLFNYNKMSGTLFVTQDQKTYIEVDQGTFKSFTFIDGKGTHTYIRVPAVKPNVFFLVIAEGPKYTAYKLTKTRFKKADYHTDGIVESGNNYDEYADDNTYYITDGKGKKPLEIDLKKKSLKNALPEEKDKIDKYFAAHQEDPVDDNFLKGLVDALNNG
jgi:hypothetical protein